MSHETADQQARFYEAEIVRLRGEIMLSLSRSGPEQAESTFRHAMTLATQQSCRALALRSGTSLARLLSATGRRSEARELLAPIFAGFTEGFDHRDLVAARTLLAELG